jgi:TPP-dependent pyruvate/acetoin dehydrogenase alpha subunit
VEAAGGVRVPEQRLCRAHQVRARHLVSNDRRSCRGLRHEWRRGRRQRSAARLAIDRARAGDGPTLLDAKTFRFRGHLLGDDSHYIAKEEMARALAEDPLPRLRTWLIAQGHATDAALTDIERSNEEAFERAVQFGLDSPYPELGELDNDVVALERAA